jgi:hypothetical protein
MGNSMRLVLLCVLCATAARAQFSQTARHIGPVSTLPARCSVLTGDVAFLTVGSIGINYCSATNTWSSIGALSSASVGPSGALAVTNGQIDVTASVLLRTGTFAPLGSYDFSGATKTSPVQTVSSDPGTCSTGQSWINTTTPAWKYCSATNTVQTVGGATTTTDNIWLSAVGYDAANSGYLLAQGSTGSSGAPAWGWGGGTSYYAAPLVTYGTSYLTFQTVLHDNWTGSTALDVYSSLRLSNSGTGNYTLDVQTSCTAPGSTDLSAPTFNTQQQIAMSLSGTQYKLWNKGTISSLTMTSCAAGNLLLVKVLLDSSHTATDFVFVSGVRLRYARTL